MDWFASPDTVGTRQRSSHRVRYAFLIREEDTCSEVEGKGRYAFIFFTANAQTCIIWKIYKHDGSGTVNPEWTAVLGRSPTERLCITDSAHIVGISIENKANSPYLQLSRSNNYNQMHIRCTI